MSETTHDRHDGGSAADPDKDYAGVPGGEDESFLPQVRKVVGNPGGGPEPIISPTDGPARGEGEAEDGLDSAMSWGLGLRDADPQDTVPEDSRGSGATASKGRVPGSGEQVSRTTDPHDAATAGAPADHDTAGRRTAGGRRAAGDRHTARGSHAEKPLETTLRDPLLTRPRWSAVAWSAGLGVLLLAAAAGLWWVSVRTLWGQTLDTIIWSNLIGLAPGWLRVAAPLITDKFTVDGFIGLCGFVAVLVVVMRRRWASLVQMAVFAALAFLVHLAKYVLPRPVLDKHLPNPSNTSPSGHTMAIVTVSVLLVMAVGLAWRAWVALFGVLAVGVGATGLVIGKWHRPSDVAVAILLTGGLALLVLAFTRGAAMDRPGTRRSSAAVQIVSTALIVTGLAAGAYALYLLVQIRPGVWMSAQWVTGPACRAAVAGIFGFDGLVLGLVLACRQATASPLSSLGLLGGPPKPVRADREGGAGRRSGSHRPSRPQSSVRVAAAPSGRYKE